MCHEMRRTEEMRRTRQARERLWEPEAERPAEEELRREARGGQPAREPKSKVQKASEKIRETVGV